VICADNIRWDKALQQRMGAGTLMIADHLLFSIANFTAGLFPSMKTYIGAQVQNVSPPAVWVDFYDQKNSARLAHESEYSFGVEVTYLPSSTTKNTDELNHAVFLLLQNLDRLESDVGPFRVYDKDSDITDGLGHVTGMVSVRELTAPDGEIIQKAQKEVIP